VSLRWAILGSGSEANCYFFQDETASVVFDAGFPLRTFRKRALRAGLDPHRVDTVFLTHTHGDHVKGLDTLLEDTKAALVHRRGLTFHHLFRTAKDPTLVPIEAGENYHRLGVDYRPFDLSHDAPLATGYHFKVGGKRFTLITDTGRTDHEMIRLAARSDYLFLESNYCPDLLARGPYPPVLRARVASEVGHLSNHQAVAFLNTLADLRAAGTGALDLAGVYLIHLSTNNNHPDRVAEVLAAEGRWPGPLRICRRSELVLGDGLL